MTVSNPTTVTDPYTFVLVHGAWHGGWCWARVADRLRAAGHVVYTPTCTGLGERSHLLSTDITLHTFVQDIVNVLVWEDLHDVVLVGHSFGGLTITGVADIAAERIKKLVYLDAFILENGISTLDTLPPNIIEKLEAGVEKAGGPVPVLAAPRLEALGLTEADDLAFEEGRVTPHPYNTYCTALQLKNPVGNNLPATYVQCTEPEFMAVRNSLEWVKANTAWPVETLPGGHCAMVSHPDEVIKTLLAAAAV